MLFLHFATGLTVHHRVVPYFSIPAPATVLFFALFCLAASLPGRGQRIVLPDGEFMDTTVGRNPACEKIGYAPYFSVDGKYPRGSETLAADAQAFLRRNKRSYAGSGYVTFRFAVDCAGFRQPRTQVLQTGAHYQAFRFRPELVKELYAFLQTLKEWRTAATRDGQSANYLAYLTFKIQDGKVVAVIP